MKRLCMMNVLFFPETKLYFKKQLCNYSSSFLGVCVCMCVYEGGERETERDGSKHREIERENLVI